MERYLLNSFAVSVLYLGNKKHILNGYVILKIEKHQNEQ
jgi:hypothetical protein